MCGCGRRVLWPGVGSWRRVTWLWVHVWCSDFTRTATSNRTPPPAPTPIHLATSPPPPTHISTRSPTQAFGQPGSIIGLSGQLGAGKSTISRGFVRAFARDPLLAVPSPTFLLCLSYADDTAHERREAAVGGEAVAAVGEAVGGAVGGAVETVGGGEAGAAGCGAGVEGGAGTATASVAVPVEAPASGSGSGSGAPEQQQQQQSLRSDRAGSVHHMDPYRLGGGSKSDKMAGLIDFGSAFSKGTARCRGGAGFSRSCGKRNDV